MKANSHSCTAEQQRHHSHTHPSNEIQNSKSPSAAKFCRLEVKMVDKRTAPAKKQTNKVFSFNGKLLKCLFVSFPYCYRPRTHLQPYCSYHPETAMTKNLAEMRKLLKQTIEMEYQPTQFRYREVCPFNSQKHPGTYP